ncbi:MAG: extracellular solute-binding protein [Pseudomonadota bacterium]
MKLAKYLGSAALVGLASTALAEDPELLVLDWSGFEEEGFYGAYLEEHGVAPSFSFFGEEEEAFQKLRSGFRADVSHPCPHSVQKWRDAGLIEPWDISQIPSYAAVDAAFKDNPVFADETGVYFIPADSGRTATLYNADEVPAEAVQTLQVFTDPAYAGRVSLPDNVDDVYALAYLATGVSDWTEATQADFEAASAWLREAHANTRAYWADGAELAQLMSTGEVLIAWSWNETFVQLSGEGMNVGFEREAAEGSSSWFCGYVNLVDGPGSEEKAHDFVEAWLQPQVTDYIVNEWGYGHANAENMMNISEETLVEVGLGPVEVPILAQQPMDNALREAQIAEFEMIKAGF